MLEGQQQDTEADTTSEAQKRRWEEQAADLSLAGPEEQPEESPDLLVSAVAESHLWW